ncbi:MAG TPA: hypothetical protein VL359_13455 [bacterium]|nr:hypothetical protein [bacterium]
MKDQTATTRARQRRPGRSIGAVLLGLAVIFVLSLGTDQVLRVLQVYPAWGQPMYDPHLSLLALAYRIVYDVAGCALTAWLAPSAPMGHALALGVIGLAISGAGVAVSIATPGLGPTWYPVALALSALPSAWLGAALHRRWHAARPPAR